MKLPRFLSFIVIFLFVIIVLLPIFSMNIAPFYGKPSSSSYNFLFNSRHIILTKNSLGLAVGTTCLCLVIGAPLAFLLQRTDLWGRRVFGILAHVFLK